MVEEITSIQEDIRSNTSDFSIQEYFVTETNTKRLSGFGHFDLPEIKNKYQGINAVFHISTSKYLHYSLRERHENYRFYSKKGIFKTDYSNLYNSPLRIVGIEDSENNDTELSFQIIDLDETKEINNFLNKIKNLDNAIGEIEGMKELYCKIINFRNSQLFVAIDNTIEQFIKYKFSFQFHVAFLSITLKLDDRIQRREKLIESALALGEIELKSKEKVYATLDGLI